ncbi:hypothetical protein N2152v2_003674 [Parachlorella kessleri]
MESSEGEATQDRKRRLEELAAHESSNSPVESGPEPCSEQPDGGDRASRIITGPDPDRGCKRSFAELWRLKVHYRAPPNVRGSGMERGHGTELKWCPKCGKSLMPGQHHVGCSAGHAAPRQAAKRQRQVVARTGSEPSLDAAGDPRNLASSCSVGPSGMSLPIVGMLPPSGPPLPATPTWQHPPPQLAHGGHQLLPMPPPLPDEQELHQHHQQQQQQASPSLQQHQQQSPGFSPLSLAGHTPLFGGGQSLSPLLYLDSRSSDAAAAAGGPPDLPGLQQELQALQQGLPLQGMPHSLTSLPGSDAY